jgi:hypothetical protein
MAKETLVLFHMREVQFVQDITATVRNKLDYPKLPTKAKDSKKDVLDLKVSIELDKKVFDKINNDPALIKSINNKLKEPKGPYDRLCHAIASTYETANAYVEAGILDVNEATAKAWREKDDQVKKAVDDMCKTAQVTWSEHFKKNNEYVKYQAQIACTLILGTISIAANIALLASTPFSMGAGTIIGIIGMAKTVTVMFNEIRHGIQEAEEVLGEVYSLYMALRKVADEKSTGGKAIEIGKEAINGALGAVLGAEPAKTLTKLNEKMERAENKINGVYHKATKHSQKIGKYSDRLETYRKNKGHYQGVKDIGITAEEMEIWMASVANKTEQKLATLLEKHEEVMKRFEALKAYADKLHDLVDHLSKDLKDIKKFGQVMKALGVLYDLGTMPASLDGFKGSADQIVNVAISFGIPTSDPAIKKLIENFDRKAAWKSELN